MPEKYVRIVGGLQDMYERVRTRVKRSVGLSDKIPLYVGSSPEPLPFRHDYAICWPTGYKIYPCGACYLLMTLYSEEKRLKIN